MMIMVTMKEKKVHRIARTMPSHRIKTTYFRFMPFIRDIDSNIFDSIRLLCLFLAFTHTYEVSLFYPEPLLCCCTEQ